MSRIPQLEDAPDFLIYTTESAPNEHVLAEYYANHPGLHFPHKILGCSTFTNAFGAHFSIFSYILIRTGPQKPLDTFEPGQMTT